MDTINSIFDFTFAPGINKDQMLGFEIAGAVWSQYLVDPVKINIYVEAVNNLGSNIAGSALPGMDSKSIESITKALTADATSSYDKTAVATLAGLGKEFDVLVGYNVAQDIKEVNYSTAVGKAMGLVKADDKKLDGYIAMNKNVQWNYNYSSNTVQGGVDYLSVAMHEIGHVLGFVSGVDNGDLLQQEQLMLEQSIGSIANKYKDQVEQALGMKTNDLKNFVRTLDNSGRKALVAQLQQITGINDDTLNDYMKSIKKMETDYFTVMDLYRYSDDSFAKGMNEIGRGEEAYFSIDGGKTELGHLADGEEDQASHWADDHDHGHEHSYGIMDPSISIGVRDFMNSLDLKALDVMGWNLNSRLLDIKGNVKEDALGFDLTNLVKNVTTTFNQRLATSFSLEVQDLAKDVDKMIKQSQYYDWRWGGGYGQTIAPSESDWRWGGGYGQTIANYNYTNNLLTTTNQVVETLSISSAQNNLSESNLTSTTLPNTVAQVKTETENSVVPDLYAEFDLTPQFKSSAEQDDSGNLDLSSLTIPTAKSTQDSASSEPNLDNIDIKLIERAYNQVSNLTMFDELLGAILTTNV
jgi:hypothetical protein